MGSVKVTYSKNDWGSGMTATVRITNNTGKAITGWKVTFSYTGNQTVNNFWSTALVQTGKAISATNLSYNGSIAPNAFAEFGFNAAYSGSNLDPIDLAVTY